MAGYPCFLSSVCFFVSSCSLIFCSSPSGWLLTVTEVRDVPPLVLNSVFEHQSTQEGIMVLFHRGSGNWLPPKPTSNVTPSRDGQLGPRCARDSNLYPRIACLLTWKKGFERSWSQKLESSALITITSSTQTRIRESHVVREKRRSFETAVRWGRGKLLTGESSRSWILDTERKGHLPISLQSAMSNELGNR